MTVWEIVFMVIILKIPVGYIGWVVWWAIKSEPEEGTQGGTESVNWTPWRRPKPSRPERVAPRGGPVRPGGSRATRERHRPRAGRASS